MWVEGVDKLWIGGNKLGINWAPEQRRKSGVRGDEWGCVRGDEWGGVRGDEPQG